MSRFAKLFDLEDGSQVLARLDYDYELKEHTLTCSTVHDDITFSASMSNSNKSVVRLLFEMTSMVDALLLREKAMKEFNSLKNETS